MFQDTMIADVSFVLHTSSKLSAHEAGFANQAVFFHHVTWITSEKRNTRNQYLLSFNILKHVRWFQSTAGIEQGAGSLFFEQKIFTILVE